jgi:hypothetical protein
MNTLTLEDLADISLDRQRAQEARNQLTHEENLTALSCNAIFEAREAADDFVNLAYEIEALLRDKDVAENKEQWVMNTRSTIAKCQGRLRLSICALVLTICKVRQQSGELPTW